MQESSTRLVRGLRHSIPYINAHRGKTFVIILRGEAIEHVNFLGIINDIGLLHSLGIRLIVVYGASPQINLALSKEDIKPIYHKDTRITDFKVLEIVKKEAGRLQLDITARLSMSLSNTPLQGANIRVVSGNFIIAQPLGVDSGVDYYHSGRIRRIDKDAVNCQLKHGAIVLIGPVAVSVTGESFNLISEEIAMQIAIELNAEKIIGFGNKQGLIDEHGNIISELFPNIIEEKITFLERSGHFNKSTVLFLKCGMQACRKGVRRAHLISYKKNGALLQELFSRDGIGTQIVMESAEQIREANIDDIGGILELIRPLEQIGTLVRRSREQLEIEIEKFTIIKRDNLTIACAALYPFLKERIGEMACVAVHPDYRSSLRGDILLKEIKLKAKKMNLNKIFVLTTQSIHWFQERGFILSNMSILPYSKKKIYDFTRCSKILTIDIC
ncbi:MAG TPA: amino-acid N-acetyltransferase [Buchnera sp. (in: enterobacteria)]|nr:amino-acid N-acetyltransferase [Buchnera sp. (in: enterobacteria)]